MEKQCEKERCEKHLMVVSSSFQLVSAILIRHMYMDAECVLVLVGSCSFFKTVESAEAFKKLFNKIISYKESGAEASLVKRTWRKICASRVLRNENTELGHILECNYNRVFYYLFPINLGIVMGKMRRKNPCTVFCKLEDGVASYILEREVKVSLKEKLGNILFGQFYSRPRQEKLYLLFPQLYVGKEPYQIERTVITENVRSVLRDICDEVVEKQIQVKEHLIFEECLDQYSNPEEYSCLVKEMAEKLGVENLSVKGHPRNAESILDVKHLEMEIPWEMFCLSYPEALQNRKLYSVLSTTCYMPHLLGVKDIESFYLYPCYKGQIESEKNRMFHAFMEQLLLRCPNIHVIDSLEEVYEWIDL